MVTDTRADKRLNMKVHRSSGVGNSKYCYTVINRRVHYLPEEFCLSIAKSKQGIWQVLYVGPGNQPGRQPCGLKALGLQRGIPYEISRDRRS
jgi:hypothetical protein